MVNVFREAKDLCIEGNDNGVDLVVEETNCFDDDINSVVCAKLYHAVYYINFPRKKYPSTEGAGIVTDSTLLVGSCIALLSYQTQLINYYLSASNPEAWRI